MLGANREDIQSIRTIGGNLDHNELSKITKTSPLTNSIAAKEFIFKTKYPNLKFFYGDGGVGRGVVVSPPPTLRAGRLLIGTCRLRFGAEGVAVSRV
jgi:hypothetical protein